MPSTQEQAQAAIDKGRVSLYFAKDLGKLQAALWDAGYTIRLDPKDTNYILVEKLSQRAW